MEDDKVLLDYYTKSKAIHATIIVAIFFGLFSLLGPINTKKLTDWRVLADWARSWPIWSLLVVYFILVAFGFYEIGRWKHYSSEAEKIAKGYGAREHVWGKTKKGIITRLFRYVEGFFVFLTFLALLGVCF